MIQQKLQLTELLVLRFGFIKAKFTSNKSNIGIKIKEVKYVKSKKSKMEKAAKR